MNRIQGLHPRTPGELVSRFPAAMAPRLVRERGTAIIRDHPLFRARVARGWSAAGLAARIGACYEAVRNWEVGDYHPNPVHRRALARAFGLELSMIDRWFDGGRRWSDR